MKKLLAVGALAAIGTAIYRRVTSSRGTWEPPYAPPPAPEAADVEAPEPVVEVPEAVEEAVADDAAGATPDEAIADATEEPHPPTTPDEPLDVVDLEESVETSRNAPAGS